jgi:uncharacterized protein YbcC (UPF0753/DUF2309 family)
LAKVSKHDTDLPKTASEIPKQVTRRLTLSWTDIADYHQNIYESLSCFTRLDGYTITVQHLILQHDRNPITLTDYLAVRLWVAKKIEAEFTNQIKFLQNLPFQTTVDLLEVWNKLSKKAMEF